MPLKRIYNKHLKKPLKLYWWRYEYPSKLNFGDELTPYIISRLFGFRTTWAPPDTCELAGAGSIIEILQQESENNHIRIWGSGFIKDGPANRSQNLDFYAVRGELSTTRTGKKSMPMGDPALLMPLAYQPRSKKCHKLGIVPHYIDTDSPAVTQLTAKHDAFLINVLDPIEKVISNINSCELIFSSSMHGIIISDAYDIPSYWTPFSNLLTGGNYKFRDYYSIYGREPEPLITDHLLVADLDRLIDSFKPKENVSSIQAELVKCFPY